MLQWLKQRQNTQRGNHQTSYRPHRAKVIHGGLALPGNKQGLPEPGTALPVMPAPEEITLPLLDYAKNPIIPDCGVGDTIQLGECLAPGVIASVSGRITAIENRPIIHPSGQVAPCVVICTEQSSKTTDSTQPVFPPLQKLTPERLERAGIVGLGGAGYSTASKLSALFKHPPECRTLLINAVECEPMISCDEALIRSDTSGVLSAVQTMAELTECAHCIIAIENNKHAAIDGLQQALRQQHQQDDRPCTIELLRLPPVYPSGAERLLVERITGQRFTQQTRATDLGLLCINVATAYAAWRAQAGYPLVSRLISVNGDAVPVPMNVQVPLGTPVSAVFDYVARQHGNTHYQLHPGQSIRAGGPLSGFDLMDRHAPVTATTHCLSAMRNTTVHSAATACIRCAACSDVCPVHLLPQQLLQYARTDDVTGARRFGMEECIECGCCDLVCPSHIPLTRSFRYIKGLAHEQLQQKREADIAQQRYQKRLERIKRREQEEQQRRDQEQARLAQATTEKALSTKASTHTTAEDPIAAALARSRSRRQQRRPPS